MLDLPLQVRQQRLVEIEDRGGSQGSDVEEDEQGWLA